MAKFETVAIGELKHDYQRSLSHWWKSTERSWRSSPWRGESPTGGGARPRRGTMSTP